MKSSILYSNGCCWHNRILLELQNTIIFHRTVSDAQRQLQFFVIFFPNVYAHLYIDFCVVSHRCCCLLNFDYNRAICEKLRRRHNYKNVTIVYISVCFVFEQAYRKPKRMKCARLPDSTILSQAERTTVEWVEKSSTYMVFFSFIATYRIFWLSDKKWETSIWRRKNEQRVEIHT